MDSIVNHPEALAVIIALPLFGVLAAVFKAGFRRIAKWYLYVAVFAVLIVMDSMFFPFIGGKDYFFRFSVELSLIFFLLAWAFEMKEGELKQLLRTVFKKPLAIAVSAFAAAYLIATAFAYDAYAAFWSNYERGEGGFQMIHYFLFFLLLVLLLRTETDWKNIFKFSLGAAGLMILYGVGGNYLLPTFIGPYIGGSVPVGWWHLLIDGRFQGTLGNPAYVAPYLIFSMFFASYLWLRRKHEGKASTKLTWGYWILMAIFLFFFLVSQTRGAFLGLIAGIYIFLMYLGYSSPRYRKWSLAVIAAAFLVGGFIVYYVHHAFLMDPNSPLLTLVPGIRLFDLPVSGRILALAGVGAFIVAAIVEFAREKKALWWALLALAVIAAGGGVYAKNTGRLPSFADPTTVTRFWVWGEAWQGFLARPITGWGPENFTAVFDKYFNPNFYVPGQSSQTWFDRAHSVYFDYLTETGVLGFLSYLSIFAVFFWEFGKGKPEGVAERGLMLALPVAYLVQGVAIFDVLPMYLPLFIFIGFAYYYFYEHRPERQSHG
jgi:O-Antigen ligase